jgi:hypothetical protein
MRHWCRCVAFFQPTSWEISINTAPEGHCLGRFEPCDSPLRIAGLDRINALEPQLTGSQRFLAGFG